MPLGGTLHLLSRLVQAVRMPAPVVSNHLCIASNSPDCTTHSILNIENKYQQKGLPHRQGMIDSLHPKMHASTDCVSLQLLLKTDVRALQVLQEKALSDHEEGLRYKDL